MERYRRLGLALLCLLLLAAAGCGDGKTDQPPATAVTIIETAPQTESAAPEVTPAPTPEPDMLFEEDGDIYFSEAYQAEFTAGTWTFDHAPRVLIYHTHAREAFRAEEPAAGIPFPGRKNGTETPSPTASGTRSTDNTENVVYLGTMLDSALTGLGFQVTHDTSDVEDPTLSTAYERSRQVMEKYPDIDIYIDLHRNAASGEKAKNDVVLLDGVRTARMFFVVGTGLKAGDGSGETDNWRENYAFALSLTERLRQVNGTLCKDIRVKQKVYNQDKGLCLLAEIGHNVNLLTDAVHTIPYLAAALKAVCVFG